MLTKKDRQSLIQDMKQVFVTKDDLTRGNTRIEKKLKTIVNLKRSTNKLVNLKSRQIG